MNCDPIRLFGYEREDRRQFCLGAKEFLTVKLAERLSLCCLNDPTATILREVYFKLPNELLSLSGSNVDCAVSAHGVAGLRGRSEIWRACQFWYMCRHRVNDAILHRHQLHPNMANVDSCRTGSAAFTVR